MRGITAPTWSGFCFGGFLRCNWSLQRVCRRNSHKQNSDARQYWTHVVKAQLSTRRWGRGGGAEWRPTSHFYRKAQTRERMRKLFIKATCSQVPSPAQEASMSLFGIRSHQRSTAQVLNKHDVQLEVRWHFMALVGSLRSRCACSYRTLAIKTMKLQDRSCLCCTDR